MSTTELARPRLRWWQGVGSPGVVGYVLADLVAVAALAAMLPLPAVLAGDIGGYVAGVVLVGVYGCFASVPLAAIGIPIVHFCCLRVRHQGVHVLAAGVVGFVAMLLAFGETGLGLVLGVATAIGRAAVIPLVARRQS